MAAEADERATSDPGTLAAFLALVAIAGGNAPAIRFISCQACELDPFWGAGMRFGLASLLVPVSAWLHDEEITAGFTAGSILVLLGTYIGALRRPKGE
jgi:hypothetical protein